MDAFHGRQLAAARALAGLTVRELAQAAGVTKGTVNRIEVAGLVHVAAKLRHGHLSREVFRKITDALARHGVELVPEDEVHRAGARWALPRRS